MAKKAAARRAEQRANAAPAAAPAEVKPPSRLLQFLEKYAAVIAVAAVLIASARIVATYNVFSHTFDEPYHIICGLEWLDHGTYTIERQHPPLARVAEAIGPYLLGSRCFRGQISEEKLMSPLFQNGKYDAVMAAARLGNLPFFWVGCIVVYVWGRRYFGKAIAAMAVFLFTMLPPILAHAGLATTDMALTSFLGAAFLSGYVWLEEPTRKHAIWFGVCTGLMMLSKYSGMAFLPVSAGLALAWYVMSAKPGADRVMRELRERMPSFGIAVLVACVLMWAAFRFTVGKDFNGLTVPAPDLFKGIQIVQFHNRIGHGGYLLGQRSADGFWYFYEVALLFKTPLGFLGLLIAGCVLALRDRGRYRQLWIALLFSGGILAVGVFSRINIGIRHVLPIYIGFSLAAAVALARAIENVNAKRWTTTAAAVAVLWMTGSSIISHPDYLPYFNELAGKHPENILVDSDLDWGQDLKRLGVRLRQVGATKIAWVSLAFGDFHKYMGFPPKTGIHPAIPEPGWNVVEMTNWKEYRLGLNDDHPEVTPWPDLVPEQQRVGKSLLLYYFPER